VFPEPTEPLASRTEVYLRYLDYFRARIADKVESLPGAEQVRSRLASAWTPLELVKHLTWVERRWLEWGFRGEHYDDPWGDQQGDRWHVGPDESAGDVLAGLRAQGERSASIVRGSPLDAVGAPGDRWDGAPPASLERILMHLVQEYARHLGHLDIAVELGNGQLGE
jgi:hypothetical protein